MNSIIKNDPSNFYDIIKQSIYDKKRKISTERTIIITKKVK